MNADERWDEPTIYLDSALTYLDYVDTLLKAVQFADTAPYTTQILEPQQMAQIVTVYKQIKTLKRTIDDIKTDLLKSKDIETLYGRVRMIQKEIDSEKSKAIKAYERNTTHA